MSILVTGGAGYIGSHACLGLLDAGYDIVVIDNLVTGFREAIPKGVTFYEGNINDIDLLKRIVSENKIDGVFHFAGSVVVPESVSNPIKYYDNNTVNSKILIEFCVNNNIKKFIFSSTAAVYGTPKTDQLISESHDTRPESPYGTSKLMTEMMLQDISLAFDFRYVALRYFNVAGADVKGRVGQSTKGATHLIKVACELATGKRDYMEIFGTDYPTKDGTCIRDYINVNDLIDAHICALRYLDRGGDSLVANCGYGNGYSVKDIVDVLERVSGLRLKVHQSPRRIGDAVSVVADSSKARRELNWVPKYENIYDTILSAYNWEKKKG